MSPESSNKFLVLDLHISSEKGHEAFLSDVKGKEDFTKAPQLSANLSVDP